MNQKDLKKLSKIELRKLLIELRGKLFVVRFQIASGKANKFSEVSKIKKDIARVLTFIKTQKNVSDQLQSIEEKK